MSSSGYAAIVFVANEQPTTAKWNLIGSNDASFNTGEGFNDGIIIARHYAAASIAKTKIDMTTFPFEVTGLYPAFYSQPSAAGTIGNTYTYSGIALPRAIVAGESVMLIPVGANYGVPMFISNTSSAFTFALNCVLTTAIMTSKWSAIYYIAH